MSALAEIALYLAGGFFTIGYFIFAGFISYAAAGGREAARAQFMWVFIALYGVICTLAYFAFD